MIIPNRVNHSDLLSLSALSRLNFSNNLSSQISKANADLASLQPEEFSLREASQSGATTITGQYCYQQGKHVHIECNVATTVSLALNATFAMIPIKYTPGSTKYCGLLVVCNSSGTVETIAARGLKLAKINDNFYGISQVISNTPITAQKLLRVYLDFVVS